MAEAVKVAPAEVKIKIEPAATSAAPRRARRACRLVCATGLTALAITACISAIGLLQLRRVVVAPTFVAFAPTDGSTTAIDIAAGARLGVGHPALDAERVEEEVGATSKGGDVQRRASLLVLLLHHFRAVAAHQQLRHANASVERRLKGREERKSRQSDTHQRGVAFVRGIGGTTGYWDIDALAGGLMIDETILLERLLMLT